MNNIRFGRLGFILAAAGSAVGLGNIWKFPYMTGENGGGAFVLVYLLTITFIGLSLFLAETIMGRLSRGDTVSAFENLSTRAGHLWKFAGFIIFTGVIILAFYTVVIGWIIKYIVLSFGALPSSVQDAGGLFGSMVTTDTNGQIFYFTLAFAITFWIVSRGIKAGIEKMNVVLMPLLIIILLVLLAYAMSLDGFGQAFSFLFMPDFSKLHSSSILAAVGHAFFTLSLGMGSIMTYGASLPEKENIVSSSMMVAFIDTAIALVAGMVIFTFIFHFGAQPAQGPGLVFVSLPALLSSLGVIGNAIAVSFFIALAFAGITSAISIVEPVVMYMMNRFGFSRQKSLFLLGCVTYIMGLLALISNIETLKHFVTFFGKGFFDILDFMSSSIMLPLGGMMIAIFVGFFIDKNRLETLLLPFMRKRVFAIWYFSIRFITPLGVLSVMINKLFF